MTFQRADAQVHPFPAEHFDIAVSRCGSMFFGDPAAAFRTILAAARDLPTPPPGGVAERPEPTDACRFVSGMLAGLLSDLDTDTRTRTLDTLRIDMAAHHTAQGVRYDAAAWLIEACRA